MSSGALVIICLCLFVVNMAVFMEIISISIKRDISIIKSIGIIASEAFETDNFYRKIINCIGLYCLLPAFVLAIVSYIIYKVFYSIIIILKMVIKNIFCKHKYVELIKWHYVHDTSISNPKVIEAKYKCTDCGRIVYSIISKNMHDFASKYDCKWDGNFINGGKNNEKL